MTNTNVKSWITIGNCNVSKNDVCMFRYKVDTLFVLFENGEREEVTCDYKSYVEFRSIFFDKEVG